MTRDHETFNSIDSSGKNEFKSIIFVTIARERSGDLERLQYPMT
jgi:hypothetical protein